MELSKIFGITGIIVIVVLLLLMPVVAFLGGGTSCPEGQQATTTYTWNAALKIPTSITVCN